jgi:hypothetical protein
MKVLIVILLGCIVVSLAERMRHLASGASSRRGPATNPAP